MKLGGWILMVLSWGTILSLGIFCFSRIFRQGLAGEGKIKRSK